MGQQGGRVRRGRRNFQLRCGFNMDGFGGPGTTEPTHSENEDDAKNHDARDERKERIGARRTGWARNARDLRHVGLKARR